MSGHVLLWRVAGALILILLVSCSDDDTIKEPLVSEYKLDDELFGINTNMYWENAKTSGEVDQIRLMEPIPNSSLFDLIIISPVPGPDSLEGNYIFSKTGDIGTYDLVFVHAFDGEDKYQWLTNGENGEQLVIDPALLDLIYDVRESLGGSGAFEVISAYRSPETNDMLRSKSSGVAKNSQHLLGNAIDVRLRGDRRAFLSPFGILH